MPQSLAGQILETARQRSSAVHITKVNDAKAQYGYDANRICFHENQPPFNLSAMFASRAVFLVVLATMAPSCTEASEGAAIQHTSDWPGFIASPPVDSYPTEKAIYVLGGSTLAVFENGSTNGGTHVVSRVLALGMGGSRIRPLARSDHLLVTGRSGFLILDVSEPLRPSVLSTYSVGGEFTGTSDDDFVYFYDWEASAIDVIDCTNPSTPTLFGRIPQPIRGTIQGDKAFGSTIEGAFEVWSISQRTNRTVLGSLPGSYIARAVYVRDSTVYLLPGGLAEGVYVFDVGNPASPKLAGRVIPATGVFDIALDGNIGWIAGGGQLYHANLADFSAIPEPIAPLGLEPQSVRDFQGLLYTFDDWGLKIFTKTNGAAVLKERVALPEPVNGFLGVSGSTALVSRWNGLSTLDLSRPNQIRETGRLDLSNRVTYLARSGDLLYVNAGPNLVAIDVADLTNIKVVSSSPMEVEFGYSAYGVEHALYYGSYEGLVVVDLTDHLKPTVISTNRIGPLLGVYRNGEYLYASMGNGPPMILDIRDQLNPKVVGAFDVIGNAWCGFAQEGNFLVVSANYISGNSTAQLVFYDVTNPARPQFLGWGPEVKVLVDMAIKAGTLYYVSGARIRAYDLRAMDRSPDHPGQIGVPMIAEAVDFSRNFGTFVLFRGNVLVAEGGPGVSVWASHLQPKVEATRNHDQFFLDFQIDPAYAYGLETNSFIGGDWRPVGDVNGDALVIPFNGNDAQQFYRLNQLDRLVTPSNDYFSSAAFLEGTNIVVSGSNYGASKEPNEPDHAGNSGGASIWWSWTAPEYGSVDLDASGSTFDVLLAVYTGSGVSTLLAVSSNEQSGGTHSTKTRFQADRGTTYSIAVDGVSSEGIASTGSVALQLTFRPVPTVDLSGLTLRLSYEGFVAEEFQFATATTGIYEHGAGTFTYVYYEVSGRLEIVMSGGQTYAMVIPSGTSSGNTSVIYQDTRTAPASTPAFYTLGI